MKVQQQKIPVDSGTAVKIDGQNKQVSIQRSSKKNSGGSLEDESDEEVYYKKMLQIPELGIVMSLAGLETITKEERFVERPSAHWEFGIVINKTVEQDTYHPVVNQGLWYDSESARDRRYKQLLKFLTENKVLILSI